MNFIACIDRMGGLGYKGQLLFHLHKDMEYFRKLTEGGVVVMGYRTYRSLPHGALLNRKNVVLSRNHDVEDEDVVLVRDKDELRLYLETCKEPVWIIGGQSLYVEFLPECKEIFLTRVDTLRRSDCFFPCPEMLRGWKMVSEEQGEEDGIHFTFEHYARKTPFCP